MAGSAGAAAGCAWAAPGDDASGGGVKGLLAGGFRVLVRPWSAGSDHHTPDPVHIAPDPCPLAQIRRPPPLTRLRPPACTLVGPGGVRLVLASGAAAATACGSCASPGDCCWSRRWVVPTSTAGRAAKAPSVFSGCVNTPPTPVLVGWGVWQCGADGDEGGAASSVRRHTSWWCGWLLWLCVVDAVVAWMASSCSFSRICSVMVARLMSVERAHLTLTVRRQG